MGLGTWGDSGGGVWCLSVRARRWTIVLTPPGHGLGDCPVCRPGVMPCVDVPARRPPVWPCWGLDAPPACPYIDGPPCQRLGGAVSTVGASHHAHCRLHRCTALRPAMGGGVREPPQRPGWRHQQGGDAEGLRRLAREERPAGARRAPARGARTAGPLRGRLLGAAQVPGAEQSARPGAVRHRRQHGRGPGGQVPAEGGGRRARRGLRPRHPALRGPLRHRHRADRLLRHPRGLLPQPGRQQPQARGVSQGLAQPAECAAQAGRPAGLRVGRRRGGFRRGRLHGPGARHRRRPRLRPVLTPPRRTMATLRRKTAAAARELPADAPAGAAADADPHARAEALIHALRSAPTAKIQGQARALLLALRERRAFDLLLRLAEALCRIDPADPLTRRLYAQALIETGALTAAIDMLRQLLATLAAQHAEAAEASGLLGRACKQIFFESGASGSAGARWALAAAIEAYAGPYRAQPERHTWHGVNLLALVSRARIEGWPDIAPEVEPLTLAVQLSARLRTLPPKARDVWYLPTLAEATLGLSLATGDLQPVEDLLAEYIGSPDVQAFQVASTLRQFTEVWGLEALTPRTRGIGLKGAAAVARARRLTDVLRARLLQLPGGALTIPAATAAALPPRITGDAAGPDATGMAAARARLKRADPAGRGPLEATPRAAGPHPLAWWRAGIEAARSVAVVRQRLGKRLGTGFLVRAGDLGLTPADESLLLTNFHAVNADGVAPGIRPDDAEVVFEAADASQAYGVASLVWSSPIDRHDASLLRLKRVPEGIAPDRKST